MVLSEQSPALTLHDVLQDCDSLRKERASDYLGQILSGLNAVHGAVENIALYEVEGDGKDKKKNAYATSSSSL